METRRSKFELFPKLKPNVGTPEKPRRKASKKIRESESLQNIAEFWILPLKNYNEYYNLQY